ncbi:MAG: type II toxin-antitoxin system prevent-host-death family antitoxin [Thermodesulfobacteriota bacterium]|nr:type II toxin-antitoxin system prevent-host-death family antitoxin [Thermodesulfobacteriota bacterium]
MIRVGIRELKTNLSRYLARVKSGENIMVTDRKKEVAVILPYGSRSGQKMGFQLVQRGLARWSGGKPEGMPSRIASRGKKVSDAVLEERR